MLTILSSPPAVEPVSLNEAKKHLRLAILDADAEAYTAEDDKISALITVSREKVENDTRRVMITSTFDGVIDYFPACHEICITLAPLQSVTSIHYIDTDGVEQAFTDFTADLYGNKIRLNYGSMWPAIYPESQIVIRFVAGYGDAGSDVPDSIKQAMLLLIGHFHSNTNETVIGYNSTVTRLPMGVDALLSGFRRFEF